MPTDGFSINPLKVKLLAGKQKATEVCGWTNSTSQSAGRNRLPPYTVYNSIAMQNSASSVGEKGKDLPGPCN